MTVTYTAEVATCRGFGCFLKLLCRWRGSIYKLVWLDLVTFLLLYYILNISYRLALSEEQKRIFESIVKYCAAYSNLIPLSFVLGFYVSIVMTRWWSQYTSIPWPDSIAVFVSSNVHGQDERGRVMRRTIMRYVCLCLTMVLTNISPRVKKRFPKLDTLIEAGLLLESEKSIMDDLNKKFPRHSKHWLAIVWAASIVTRARKEGRIRDDFAVKTVIDELNKFRGQCGLLISYDTISVPLVYTQVVTLAVYSYFLTSVMGQQWTEDKTDVEGYANRIDMYFPLFTTLQFFFYMGWLKVAESLINPFGEDDDDFEVNWMVDRNLQVSYMIVDEMHHEHPELLRDQYWDEVPTELPYTIASEQYREEHPQPSTANIEVTQAGAEVIPVVPSSIRVDEMVGKSTQSVNYKFPEQDTEAYDDNASGIHFTAGRGINRERYPSGGSTASMQSVIAGSMARTVTVASALKRFFSREDSRPGSSTTDVQHTRLPGSVSSASLAGGGGGGGGGGAGSGVGNKLPGGSMRITDQVIEEVDEQMTITSNRGGAAEPRPTAESLFKLPASSDPVDMPKGRTAYARTQSAIGHDGISYLFPVGGAAALLSSSAPLGGGGGRTHSPVGTPAEEYDRSNMGSRGTQASITEDDNETETVPGTPDDDFERLRQARERERTQRQQMKIARSISTQPTVIGTIPAIDTDISLEQLGSRSEELNLTADKSESRL